MIWPIKILQNRRFERSLFTLRDPAPFKDASIYRLSSGALDILTHQVLLVLWMFKVGNFRGFLHEKFQPVLSSTPVAS